MKVTSGRSLYDSRTECFPPPRPQPHGIKKNKPDGSRPTDPASPLFWSSVFWFPTHTPGLAHALTFVVVHVVVALALQLRVAVQAVPSVRALALPHVVAVDPALSVPRTAVRTSLQRAVFAVPAGHAQARAVLALSVLVAPVVAQLRVAVLAGPAGVARAGVAHAVAVSAAVQVAQFWGETNKKKKPRDQNPSGTTTKKAIGEKTDVFSRRRLLLFVIYFICLLLFDGSDRFFPIEQNTGRRVRPINYHTNARVDVSYRPKRAMLRWTLYSYYMYLHWVCVCVKNNFCSIRYFFFCNFKSGCLKLRIL